MTVRLEDLEVYQLAEELADLIWNICVKWDWFPKETLGKQLVKAVDSIGANVAEGYGRFAFRENIQFCYYARGSLMEVQHFVRAAKNRQLFNERQIKKIDEIIGLMGPKLNAYIRSIKTELNKTR